MAHREWHRSDRIGWLRAAVLGANDGVISTASLMVGVAATGSTPSAVLTAGVAGLAAAGGIENSAVELDAVFMHGEHTCRRRLEVCVVSEQQLGHGTECTAVAGTLWPPGPFTYAAAATSAAHWAEAHHSARSRL